MDTTRNRLRTYIIENFLFGEDDGFDDTASFLESGIIDSTGILEVIAFLEEDFGIKVKDDELVPENLDSVMNLERYLSEKTAAAS